MTKHILYLASGSGKRFGGNKLMFQLDGKALYLWGLETLARVVRGREDCSLTLVSRYEAIRRQAAALGIRAVDSPESELGISHTIQAGIRSLGTMQPEDYLLFAVADQPYMSGQSVEALLQQAEAGVTCASLCYGDRPGNPTLFSAALVPELLALEGDAGGRAVLKKHPCAFVQAGSEAELRDLDFRPAGES